MDYKRPSLFNALISSYKPLAVVCVICKTNISFQAATTHGNFPESAIMGQSHKSYDWLKRSEIAEKLQRWCHANGNAFGTSDATTTLEKPVRRYNINCKVVTERPSSRNREVSRLLQRCRRRLDVKNVVPQSAPTPHTTPLNE